MEDGRGTSVKCAVGARSPTRTGMVVIEGMTMIMLAKKQG